MKRRIRMRPMKNKLMSELIAIQRMWVPRLLWRRRFNACGKFIRCHRLHKMDVMHKRIGKGYSLTMLSSASRFR